jgi:hypothetical protein
MAKEVLELEVKSNIGEVTKGTKELTNEASSAVGEFRFMGVSLNGVKKAFASAAVTAKGMFGSIKAGLISSGIGAFVVLIGSLIAYFKSTKDGAEKLERAMAGFGAVVSVITDRLSTFGEVIVSAFENPQQAVKDLWEAIKTNIVNRVEGLFDVFGALGDTIKAAFNLDWKGVKAGAADFTESMIQTATGVDDLTGKMAKGFKSLGDEIEKDVAAAMRLKGMLQQLKDEEREFSKVRAQTRQDIQKARLDALDESKTAEERLAAVQKANDLELKTTEDVLKMQKRKIEVQKETMGLSENMAEDLDELASLEVELIDLQTASFQTQKRLATEMETLKNEIAAKEKARHEERMKEVKATQDLLDKLEILRQKDQFAKELLALENETEADKANARLITDAKERKRQLELIDEIYFEKYLKLVDKYHAVEVDGNKKSEKSTTDTVEARLAAFSGLANALSGLAGDNKELAAAGAIIDTYAGANKAFQQGGVAGFVTGAAIIAAGLNNVQKIYSTPVGDSGGGGETPAATTPAPQMMSGAFQLGGGVKPEPMKAFVVTDEMSNSQSQLANIRRRATI